MPHPLRGVYAITDENLLAGPALMSAAEQALRAGLALLQYRNKSGAIIGITCHSDLRLAQRAEDAGADYVAFGRFYPSLTKPNTPPASLQVLQQTKAQLAIPIVAIGGINTENGQALVTAGAGMLAVIHTLFASPDVEARATALNALFRTPQTLVK